jgi:aminodeoxyfutalosine synthase
VTFSAELTARLAEGRRLTDGEIASLVANPDIIELGMLADDVRRRRHGTRTTFVRVAAVPAAGPPELDIPPAAGELRIIGQPATTQAALERVRQVSAASAGVPVSGFSLADLERLAGDERQPLRAFLEDLRAAGLELVAEAPVDQLQARRRSIEEVNIAGLTLARATVYQLPSADVAAFFKSVAELQRETAVIRVFAPLPRKVNPAVPTTGYDDVKRVALARLIVENVPSIQVDWSLYGPKLAQVVLTMGADDIDAVSAVDDTGTGVRRSALEEIRRNVRAVGQSPVERNGRFELISS